MLIVLVGAFFVSTAQKPTDAKLPIDSKVKIGKLANGLTYYIRKNVEPKNKKRTPAGILFSVIFGKVSTSPSIIVS